jgi:hypothetical protein
MRLRSLVNRLRGGLRSRQPDTIDGRVPVNLERQFGLVLHLLDDNGVHAAYSGAVEPSPGYTETASF